MRNLVITLILLSGIGFVLAVIASLTGGIARVSAEGFSNGCTNLALIAIALSVYRKQW
jgi:hypothetical protein